MRTRTKWALWGMAGALLFVSGAASLARTDRSASRSGSSPSEAEADAPPGKPRPLLAPGGARLLEEVRAPAEPPRKAAGRVENPSTPSRHVVGGTVLDEEGEPVLDARVQLFRDATAGQWYSGTKLQDDLTTDALGRFEGHQKPEVASIGVQVVAEGFLPHGPEIVRLPTEELRIVLERGGWLGGRVLFAGTFEPTIELTHDGNPAPAPRAYTSPDEHGMLDGPDRFFLLGPLRPGAYSLACGFPWSTERIRVDGLLVLAGHVSRDARLDPLDLRGTAATIRLSIVDGEDRNVSGAVISLPRVGSENFVNVRPEREGQRWLVQAGPLPLRIRVEAVGYRTQELPNVDSDRRVVLERGLPVRLEIIGALPELPADWELRGKLTRQNWGRAQGPLARESGREPALLPTEGVAGIDREPALLFEQGMAEVYLSEPGAYLFFFRVQGDQAGMNASFWDEPQPVLEVRDDGTLQLFQLPAPSEATLEEMRAFIAKEERGRIGPPTPPTR